jgi:hypothetical protein
MKRDAEQKGGSLESGTCHKAKIGDPDLGQGSTGKDMYSGAKPAPNPSVSAPRGHTIK